ncbi:ATP-binding region ATPase domain protein [Desulfurispirillum indicum S5]|uniref:histidine kinase n=1 Tax=Desulfurispirillum indicum (strain ATCC BAA-1389 / DSM 22839 / S5) TaxID=653733 RepID=E6W5S5_DESIS|nr:HAMP domain-containing sensor histidine kinase [Desulfurispirillum indicum]ADU67210.1 ATP-binding region ATPase domain protein [Desulfurispirillum indicum S5]
MTKALSTRQTLVLLVAGMALLAGTGSMAWVMMDPCPFLLSSSVIRLMACLIAVAIYLRWRDWRILPLALMFFLMALRQMFTLLSSTYGIDEPWLVQTLVEGPGFVVTVLALLGVLYLWRVFANQARAEAAEAEAAHRRRQIHQILDSQPSLVALADSSTVLSANRSLLDFMGSDSLEALGTSVQWLRDLFEKGGALEPGQSWGDFLIPFRQKDIAEVRLHLAEKDGQPRVFLARLCPFADSTEEIIVTLFDITALEAYQRELEQRHTEQRHMLVQQSRLAALGEMTGVIAHQWKQPLNTINWQVQMLQEQVAELDNPRTAAASQSLQSILGQLDFMNRTITNFRNFFHPQAQATRFNVCQAVNQVMELLQVEFRKHHIHFDLQCDVEGLNVWGRMNEFQQAVLNIVVNSRDAITALRRKRIEADGAKAGRFDGVIRITCRHPDEMLEMTITDNGGGVSAEILPRVFERFVSARQDEDGSGIGLYVAKIIIEEHMGGSICLENGETGAVVSLRIPVSQN